MESQQQELFQRDPDPWVLDEVDDQLVATVVFPEAPTGEFDYVAPDELRGQIEPGRRLRVPLGRGNRTVVGYCIRVGQPASGKSGARVLKPIKAVIDARPLISPAMLRLTEWMADYYLCPLGQVLEAVIPAGVRGQAGTREVTLLSVPTNVAARLTQLKLPKKQAQVLRTLAASPRKLTAPELAAAAGCTLAPINGLRKKQLIAAEVRRIDQSEPPIETAARQPAFVLNADQQQALNAVLAALHAKLPQTFLIHGVTGSGKTEVYIRAIEEVVSYGKQAIVLVPEISLTPQTRDRFRSRFASVAVLHSHLTPVERHSHWRRIARGEVQVVVGARSAIFAPTPNLGLIVIDEEHDASFKQDSAPRYHARDVAQRRSELAGAPLVLGSATPSLESWRRARVGEYQLLSMPRRVYDRPLPDVAAIDLRTEFRNRRTRGAVSRQLHQAIDQSLKAGGQVILLLNRRGFSTNIQCPACGHVVKCPNCDIALTHHRPDERVVCHYCDHHAEAPLNCPECNFAGIRYAGLGTQRLEAEIKSRFPDAPCLRMDSDSMQKAGSHDEALQRFRNGEIKILLGTQMIAKGLDFPNVTLVGVVNADTALHFPDFRAAERTFNLVTQVAGRTGRGDSGGRVLVQTFSPDHPALVAAMRHDYERFAESELPVREQHGYPPFGSMIRVIVRGPSERDVEHCAETIVERMRGAAQGNLPARILGPAPCPIAKLHAKFRFHALLIGDDIDAMRSVVRAAVDGLKTASETQWVVDVDPLSLL